MRFRTQTAMRRLLPRLAEFGEDEGEALEPKARASQRAQGHKRHVNRVSWLHIYAVGVGGADAVCTVSASTAAAESVAA